MSVEEIDLEEINAEIVPHEQRAWMTWIILAITVACVGWLQNHTNPGVTAFVVAVIICLPGASLMSIFAIRPTSMAGRGTLAVGLGILSNCVVGGVMNYLRALYGIAQPLAIIPTSITLLIVSVISIFASQLRGRDPVRYFFEGQSALMTLRSIPFVALPVVSVLGAARLNNQQSPALAEVALILAVLTLAAGITYAYFCRENRPPLGLVYFSTLGILLSSSLRGDRSFGWDIQKEYGVMAHTISQQIWHVPANHDAYASMLSLTIFPSMLSSVAGLSALTFCRVLVPMLLALLPVAVIAIMSVRIRFMEKVQPPIANWICLATASCLIIGAAVFPNELPAIGRQSIAMIMVAGIILAWFDADIAESKARIVSLSLLAGLAFVHYTTAYILMVIISGAWLSILLARFIRKRFKADDHTDVATFGNLITWVAVSVSTSTALLWNLLITHNDALSLPRATIAKNGVGLVSVISTAAVSAKEYSKAILQEAATIKWLEVPPGASSYSLVDDKAPTVQGIVPGISKYFHGLTFASHEMIILMEVLGLGFLLWMVLRNRSRINLDVFGLAFALVALSALLRFSGSLGSVFNPARVLPVAGICMAVPVGLLIQAIGRRYRGLSFVAVGALAVVLMVDTVGLGSLLTGGTPPASLVAKGENPERFIVSSADFGTAQWLGGLPKNSVVATDRYGYLPLLSVPGPRGLIPHIAPGMTDKNSFVFASMSNIKTGRARGKLPHSRGIAVFQFPADWFYENYSVVYSTGVTRVYH